MVIALRGLGIGFAAAFLSDAAALPRAGPWAVADRRLHAPGSNGQLLPVSAHDALSHEAKDNDDVDGNDGDAYDDDTDADDDAADGDDDGHADDDADA